MTQTIGSWESHLIERAALGDRFSLRAFHDALLAHGTVPVALVRERVLADLRAAR